MTIADSMQALITVSYLLTGDLLVLAVTLRFFVDRCCSFVKEKTSYLQDLGDYCTSKKGINGKHQPTPRNSDLQCHLKQSILIKVIVAIRSKMLGICRPAQH